MATWFYKHGTQSIGPINETTMRDWIKNGALAPAQLVRSDGSADWQRADRCFDDLMNTNRFPDLLARIATPYFEYDGLCFMPVLDAIAGRCRVNLFYQNCFSQACHAQIWLAPGVVNFWGLRTAMKPLTLHVTCLGGEFGVVRRLYAVPAHLQGKKARIDITGEASYPNGKGDMLRFQKGLTVGEHLGVTGGISRVILSIFGIHVFSRPARMTCALPKRVAEAVPEERLPEKEIIWSLPEHQDDKSDAHLVDRSAHR